MIATISAIPFYHSELPQNICLTDSSQTRTLRAEVFDVPFAVIAMARVKLNGKFGALKNSKANTAPATVNVSDDMSPIPASTLFIHDVAEGNISGNSVCLGLRIIPATPPSSPLSD